MKIPRDLSGADLIKRLDKLGYVVTRQTGSHVRLSKTGNPVHHLTIPAHNPLRVGTLSSILADVAAAENITKDALMEQLFG